MCPRVACIFASGDRVCSFFEFSVLITNLRYTLILVGLIGMFDTFYYVTFTVPYATDTTHIESDDEIYLTWAVALVSLFLGLVLFVESQVTKVSLYFIKKEVKQNDNFC